MKVIKFNWNYCSWHSYPNRWQNCELSNNIKIVGAVKVTGLLFLQNVKPHIVRNAILSPPNVTSPSQFHDTKQRWVSRDRWCNFEHRNHV